MASGCSGKEQRCFSSSASETSLSIGVEYPTTCKLFFLNSAIFLPSGVMIYASLIFHSLGTVQSKTFVPDGTSWITSGICSSSVRSVSRRPFPVILLQIGKRRSASSYISPPSFFGVDLLVLRFIFFGYTLQQCVRIILE